MCEARRSSAGQCESIRGRTAQLNQRADEKAGGGRAERERERRSFESTVECERARLREEAGLSLRITGLEAHLVAGGAGGLACVYQAVSLRTASQAAIFSFLGTASQMAFT